MQVPDGATVALVPRLTKHIHRENQDYIPGESEFDVLFSQNHFIALASLWGKSLAIAPALCCCRRLRRDLDPHRIVRILKMW